MNDHTFQNFLADHLMSTRKRKNTLNEKYEDIRIVNTYEDKGILTMNKGLVVRLEDGSEFHMTIYKSK